MAGECHASSDVARTRPGVSIHNRIVNFVAVGALMLCFASGMAPQAQQRDSQRAGAGTAADSTAESQRKFLKLVEENPSSLADFRQSCADGKEVGKVKDARASLDPVIPNASETCPLVIERQVRDGAALAYYRRIVADGGGNVSPQQALKNTAAAAMSNQAVVSIGNGKGFTLTDAIAWDAGEVVGSSDSSVTMQSLGLPPDSTANAAKINQTAEACLDSKNPHPLPASACFTAGLVKAVMDRPVAARK